MAIVIGTNGDDDLDGTANNDLIVSGNGDDTIEAGDGHDLIFAGNGDNTVDGGAGNDVIVAGRGDDEIDGGDGDDLIFGGRGDDAIEGGDGNDLIFGGSGDDTIDGGEGCDVISAGRGNDTVIFDVDENAGAQNYFSGGSGNDTLRLRLTQAQVNEMTAAGVFAAFAAHVGSSGAFDFSTFGLSFPFNLKVWRFEQLEIEITGSPALFTSGDDTVDFNTVLASTYQDGTQYDGLDGNDTVTLANDAAAAAAAGYVEGTAFNAGAGDDTVNGGALNDIINGDAGNDVLNGGTGVDVLNGGDDDDRLILEDINVGDTVDGGAGNDTFVFAAADGSDHILAVSPTQVTADGTSISVINVENYEISGADGNDILVFGAVATGDIADGKAGTDTFIFDDDTAASSTITVGPASVTVDGAVISLIDIEAVRIEAGAGDDIINGGALGEVLQGQAGNDTILGNDGNDIVQGGTGIDDLSGGMGDDSLSMSDANTGDMADGGDGIDTFTFDDDTVTDSIIVIDTLGVTVDGELIELTDIETVRIEAGGGNDNVTGDAGNNIIQGQDGNDNIEGDAGNNILQGGAGNDVIAFSTGNNTVDGGPGDDFVVVRTGAANVTADLVAGTIDVTGFGNSTVANVNSIITREGDDLVTGNAFANRLFAGEGDNTINAGDGNDQIIVGSGVNTIDGEGGLGDSLGINAPLMDVEIDVAAGTIEIDGMASGTVVNVEAFATDSGNDTFIGTGGNDLVQTFAGNDRIFARGGSDFVRAGDDNDLVFVDDLDLDNVDGGDGSDTIQFNFSQSVSFDMGSGVATLVGGTDSGTYTNFEGASIFGSGGSVVTGTNTSNNVQVSGSNNTVSLLDGNDNVNLLNVGDNNTLDGGAGTFDSIRFDTNSDVTVDLSTPTGTYTIGTDMGTLTGFEVIRTRAGDDTVTGSDNNDRIEVSTGMDTVSTGLGDDNIFITDGGGDDLDGGGGDNDGIFIVTSEDITIDLSLAADNLQVGADAVSTVTNIENVTAFGGNDTLIGSAGRDNLAGGEGDDVITSGLVTAGLTDAISGGAGNDTLIFNGASVQASGGLGLDAFVFKDFGGGASQFAQLFDVDPTEGDHIDLTDWGITEAQIQAGYTDLGADSQVTVGNLTILIRGIDNSEFSTSFFDFVV